MYLEKCSVSTLNLPVHICICFYFRRCFTFSPWRLCEFACTWEAPFSTFRLLCVQCLLGLCCCNHFVELSSSSRPSITRGLCVPSTNRTAHTWPHTYLLNGGRKFWGIKDSSNSNGDRRRDIYERGTFSKTSISLQRPFPVYNVHSLLWSSVFYFISLSFLLISRQRFLKLTAPSFGQDPLVSYLCTCNRLPALPW